MATKRRKLEVHRLTISGLVKGTDYGNFLRSVRELFDEPIEAVHQTGTKCHCMDDVTITKGQVRLRFYSYSEGDRPPVINTSDLSITPNPLGDDETFLTWTHVLGTQLNSRFVLIIERVQTGIWPSKIEDYLQWMVDKQALAPQIKKHQASEREPITVSIEPDPGEAFMKKVLAMDRITSAAVRFVRPNPGWKDLDRELGGEADESDAHYAEVKMNARRSSSLSKDKGIIKAMREMDHRQELGHAIVEGKIGEENEKVSSDRTVKHTFKRLPTDAKGNVDPDGAFAKFTDYLDSL